MSINFNDYAGSYARNRRVQPNVLRSLLRGAALEPRDHVLEIGCGSANYLKAMISATGATGFGIDPSPAMLEQARANEDAMDIRLVDGAAESLPFPDRSFAFAYMVDVIHHVRDRARRRFSVPGAQRGRPLLHRDRFCRRYWAQGAALDAFSGDDPA